MERICINCGKVIERKDRYKFCSPECKNFWANRNKKTFKPHNERCKWCGQEYLRKTESQHYCSKECALKYNRAKSKIMQKVKIIAKNRNLEIRNEDKIVNAKIMLFKDGDLHRCPCDGNNPKRYCGSVACIQDIIEKGHCHCNLLWRKENEEERLD